MKTLSNIHKFISSPIVRLFSSPTQLVASPVLAWWLVMMGLSVTLMGCAGVSSTVKELKGDNASFSLDYFMGHLHIERSMPGATNFVVIPHIP